MHEREFYLLAAELISSESPAKIRTAISRAYYSAFHAGPDALRALGFAVSKGGAAHGEVARCFANSNAHRLMVAARDLADVHTSRIRADYQLQRADIEDTATARPIVQQALGVREAFENVASDSSREEIRNAIAKWRKANGYP